MMTKNSKILVLLFLSLLTLANSKYDEGKVRIFNQNHFHYVMGGSSPVEQVGQYKYHPMMDSLSKIVNATTQYRLISISLLNFFSSTQTKYRYVEQNFYNQSPGRPNQAVTEKNGLRSANFYHSFPVTGSYINPSALPGFLRKTIAKYYKYFDFDSLQAMFKVINRQMGHQIHSFIYVHSQQGLDRVSYALGAYKLSHNSTMQQVMEQNLKMHNKYGRNSLGYTSYNGLKWFCLSLGRSEQQCLQDYSSKNKTNQNRQL